MHKLLKPRIILEWADRVFPYFAAASMLLVLAALYIGFFSSPPDYQQGEAVRMMYVHVPAAWMALGIYAFIGSASFIYLVWKQPLADTFARAAAPTGAAFTLLCLISGSLWGKPIWGTWWEWDARMTSVLILFFLYLGHISLSRAFDSPERAAHSCALISIVGLINLPIIKFSVEWWNTLHQPASVLRMDGPAIDPSMLLPLSLMFGGFMCFFLVLLVIRIKADILAKKIRRHHLQKII